MQKMAVTSLLAGSLVTASLTGAADRVARLLLFAGLPTAAAMLTNNPDWKGAALYAAHRWTQAADAFRQSASPSSAYNLGNALAQAGQYSAAINAYDEALARDPTDEDAESNRAIVERLMKGEPTNAEISNPGAVNAGATREGKPRSSSSANADAESTGSAGRAGGREVGSAGASARSLINRAGSAGYIGTSAGARTSDVGGAFGSSVTLLENRARIEGEIDAHFIQADQQWLQTLPDDPRRFLKLRLALEHARRVDAGTAPPITGDPW